MTNAAGCPVADKQNSVTAGPRGPVLMQDVQLLEKMAHSNRQRVPELLRMPWVRVLRHGHSQQEYPKYTCAKPFSQLGNSCETFVRFSKLAGALGSADTIRDPLKFSDFIHSPKRLPNTGLRDNTMQWDFWSLSPESRHQVTRLFGKRGISETLRHMDGFGSHTFSVWNAQGERFWVKWHLKILQGIESLSVNEAGQIAGSDPDHHRRDLFLAIETGVFPKWSVQVQIMPEADAAAYNMNPFDLTKVWPYADYPLHEVGELGLNRNPVNHFAEVEQAAFEPGNYRDAGLIRMTQYLAVVTA